ncbi:hypothetical protein SAMN05428967_2342 [Phyllobacterium sp. YR620]|jgi:hypothetical protein|uniref:hypothetical protein n=1 Tax=Phyllobacterium sp. YR620 TaxID=1881066 RepID=UPI00087E2E02|nr:hypothetical protein [Phyllobacterium sp. YR620]SDP48613.1 hypothetical protein SAMN05428967_2342 [Phyllobacterium sp. YR620]
MTFSIAHQRLKSITTAAIGLAVSVLVCTDAQAGENRNQTEGIRSVYLVKYRVNNEIRYAKKPARQIVKVSASQYMRSNPYVCTPSGFGQKARCYTQSF